MINPAYLVGTGAAIGALLRYGTNQYVRRIGLTHRFPSGTFTVNVIGSFVLALLTFGAASDAVLAAVGTGACGAYTTFSSFAVDTVQLWESDDHLLAGWYAVANLLGALLAIGLAWRLTSVF